ncbi:AAA+ ATPase domain-containing protein [Artemisia annua]|uniref:AAA+ ATPase domain-containing protein n=1 Tax=Artemisia annua TaxID=35608 RepID=A0A2U1LK63_ARTAN|nr:AAA+ ATPase domain-containing protein [Artemisia annua]
MSNSKVQKSSTRATETMKKHSFKETNYDTGDLIYQFGSDYLLGGDGVDYLVGLVLLYLWGTSRIFPLFLIQSLFGWSPPRQQPLTPVSEVSEPTESPSPYMDITTVPVGPEVDDVEDEMEEIEVARKLCS